jgi:uncharacterized 2Fe-2S/4Fe-4S cluster protein (DUF4445 family)
MAPPEITITFEPLGRRSRARRGTTLLAAARQTGVGLRAVCGGSGTCGTCRVRVLEGSVSSPTPAEQEALSDGFRLACQTQALSDVRVDVPPRSVSAPQRAQIESREAAVEIEPTIQAFEVALSPPGGDDLRADASRLCDTLNQHHGLNIERVTPEALRHLPMRLRDESWHVSAIVRQGEVIAVNPVGTTPLGLAVDIGTTKLAVYLVDLDSGETLAASGTMNPQIAYGEDVMTRIAYTMRDEGTATELQAALIAHLNEVTQTLCDEVERDRREIVEAVLVGNTCMHHLALGLPVHTLGVAPYAPVLTDNCDRPARDLGLELAPSAYVHALPNIAGFVGADHVAMLLATDLHQTQGVALALDIGTNTEISLAVGNRLYSCSCASGPAFEGAHIHDGMRAAPGAIERVWLEDMGHDPAAGSNPGSKLDYETIEDAAPVGFCGSGILDAVAVLRRIGVVQANGTLRANGHPRVRGTGRATKYVVVSEGERGAPRDLVVTRSDINEIQLAKAAIRAGVEVLLKEAGIDMEVIEKVIIAGAFGTYLNVASARAIGMFPPLPRERFIQVGNAAGGGAKMALLSHRKREQAAEIAECVTYVELTGDQRFVPLYTEALIFPAI